MFSATLKLLLEGQRLDCDQARKAMGLLMDGQATHAQMGAFLAALKVRGESFDEVVGFAQALRERVVPVKIARAPLLDTCGTGGDGCGTFNISTTVAFIAAGAGAAVAKHGNRAVSSKCGSADVLESLGVKTDIAPALAARCVEEAGVGFLFAPGLHPAMKQAAPVRRELGTRTVFNLLGPLVNPAGARRQLLGVYSVGLVPLMAKALQALGSEEAIVVCSRDGLDEFSLRAPAVTARLSGGKITESEVDPSAHGFGAYGEKDFEGGDAARNGEILLSVLAGDKGPARDVCLWNAAAALQVSGLASDWKQGLEGAAQSIDSGKAAHALAELRRLSHA